MSEQIVRLKSYIIRITQGESPFDYYQLIVKSGKTTEECLQKALDSFGIEPRDQYDYEINMCGEGEALRREIGSKVFYKIQL